MKKDYITPELERVAFQFKSDVLAVSDPETADSGGGTGQGNASSDPFSELP